MIEIAETKLWEHSGEQALAYLIDRGLKPETLKQYRIGYIPRDCYESLEEWGLPESDDKKCSKVWIPHGIVIPCITSDRIWYVKIRRLLTQQLLDQGQQKYIKIKGSQSGVFGVANLRGAWLSFLTEGEFDCMLLDQEAGSLVGVATLGSVTDRIERLDLSIWGKYFLPISHLIVVYDNDKAGQNGGKLLAQFSSRMKQMSLPDIEEVNDITDLWKSGRDLADWVARMVEQSGIPIPSFEVVATSDLGAKITMLTNNDIFKEDGLVTSKF